MLARRLSFLMLFAVALGVGEIAKAEAPAAPDPPAKDRWIDPAGISGSLVIVGGGAIPDRVLDTFKRLGGESPELVVIPTASRRADNEDNGEAIQKLWSERGFEKVNVLHTRDREQANDETFCLPLTKATAVWFNGGQQSRLADAYSGTRFEREVMGVLSRGGVVGGTSAGAAIQTELMIASGNPMAKLRRGLPLLPDAIVDQHFSKRNRKPRLLGALGANHGRFGVGIDEATALVVRGRRMQVVGVGKVTIAIPAGADRDAEEKELGERGFADLTSLRRVARDRQNGVFPSKELAKPIVKKGALMIVGGGGMPADLVKRFIELAGGPDAKIVVAPTAIGDPLPPNSRFTAMFTRQGAKNVVVVRQRTKADVESEAFRSALKDAGGVWFGGGRQWRFMDAYEGTQAPALFHKVLERGGVIGGSSAGASIQAEYMVRGNPLGNTDMMAWGYERGLNFLGGVAIDQHFTQRRRHADLESVIVRHPQLLGIGIDETTAIIVQGRIAEVAGKNDTYFLDAKDGEIVKTAVAVGEKYDLVKRKKVEEKKADDEG